MSKPWTPDADQLEALDWALSHPHCGLILDPGFGKTSITLAVITALIEAREVRRVLVVAPMRVAQSTWPNEGDKWSDFNHLSIFDICDWDEKGRNSVLVDKRIHIVTINPESLHLILDHPRFHTFGFDMLVIDESTKFKDSQTKRFKKLKTKLYLFKRRMILTGTMVPNGLQDLFGQVFILDQGKRLGEYITHFRMRYMFQIPGKAYEYFMHPGSAAKIYDKVKDILLRKSWSTKPGELPELLKNVIEVDYPESHRAEYTRMEKKYIAQVESKDIVAGNASVAGIKLRQFANGFVYWDEPDVEASLAKGKPVFNRRTEFIHDNKVNALLDLVESMNGRPLLVAYEFDEDRIRIEKAIPGVVDLGRSLNIREDMRRFNAGEIPVAIGHPASIGHGLNLQDGCQTICFFNPIWNLEHYLQFIARIYRRGSPFPYVMVHHIVCRGTRDVRVAEAIKNKEIVQEDFDAALLSSIY
jgi:hypothetical protein